MYCVCLVDLGKYICSVCEMPGGRAEEMECTVPVRWTWGSIFALSNKYFVEVFGPVES